MTVKQFCEENKLTFMEWADRYENTFLVHGGRKFLVNYHDSGRIMGIHEIEKPSHSVCYNCSKEIPFRHNLVEEVGCFCDNCI